VSVYIHKYIYKKTWNIFEPDGVTFIGVLPACGRAGFVEKGHQYFESIIKEHGIYLIWVC
jgi:pentatricopeptide repeat protein